MIRSVVCWSILFVLVSGTLLAQLPPIIDREIFFGDPEISGAQLAQGYAGAQSRLSVYAAQ